MEKVIGQRWEVYGYETVKDKTLKKGEMVLVKNATYHDGITLSLIGDGESKICELYKAMNAKIPTPADVDGKQPKIIATGAENLLTAPNTVGGQPGTIPIESLTPKDTFDNEVQELYRQLGTVSPEGLENLPALLADLKDMPDMLATEVQALKDADTATFIIDSNEKLKAWADNDPGNDYTHVRIKTGTWTLDIEPNRSNCGTSANPKTVIDISDGRTLSVVGEAGSGLVINITPTDQDTNYFFQCIKGRLAGIYPNFSGYGVFTGSLRNTGKYLFENVNIKMYVTTTKTSTTIFSFGFVGCVNLNNCEFMYDHIVAGSPTPNINLSDEIFGFLRCASLTNCTANIDTVLRINGGGMANGYGFSQCVTLTNCTVTCYCEHGGGGASSCYGFSSCDSLTRCVSKVECSVGAYPVAKGFSDCRHLVNCDGVGEANNGGYKNEGYGFSGCSVLVGCRGKGASTNFNTSYEISVVADFYNCRAGFFCRRSAESTKHNPPSADAISCYMELADGTTKWANTAAGGYNYKN
jgi:hypothetical protein